MHLRSAVMCFVLPSAVLGGLGGCALYSETRDKQGQEALKAWQEVDLAAQVAVPRKNMAALLAQQLQREDESARAIRDNRARAIATGGTVRDTLITPVDTDLSALAGSPAAAKEWDTAQTAERKARRKLEEAQAGLLRLGLEVPDCAALEQPGFAELAAGWSVTPLQAGIVRGSIAEMRKMCGAPAFTAAAKVGIGNALAAARTRLGDAALALAARRAQGLAARNSYRAAMAEYDVAAAALKTSPDKNRARVSAAAARLKTAADALGLLDDAFSIHFLSEQKRDALNETLSTVLDRPEGGALPEDASRAGVALAVFPDLLDKANVAFADARKPILAPLLLQKNLEQIKADAAKRDVDAQLTFIATLEQLLAAQSRQVHQLLKAREALASAVGKDIAAEVLGPGRPVSEQKMQLWRATTYYLDATGPLSAEAGKIHYKLLALEQERALAYSESSILQWQTLIGSNVAQLAEYGASGVKPEHVAALLNSASLLAIAIGTN